MSHGLPPIQTFDLHDPRIRAEIARLGEHYDKARFVIVGHEAAIALSYGRPYATVPCMASWAYGYPYYEALLILTKQYDLPLYWDDDLAEKLVEFFRQEENHNKVIPKSSYKDVATIMIAIGVIKRD